MLSVITTLEFFQHHFAKRPPPGGYVLTSITGN